MSPLRLPCASPTTPFVALRRIPWGGSPLSLLAAGLPATARPGCCWAGLIHSGVCPQGRFRVSHVPWEPQCALAVLLDPGRTSAPGSSRRSGAAPAVLTTKAPTLSLFRCSITRLRHWLFTLRAAISGDYAKLASGRWPTFSGWDWVPTEFLRAVSTFTLPLLQGFSWRDRPPGAEELRCADAE